MSEQVEQVRHFNRAVTQRLGVLQDCYLARDRPLGQARLLWEIGRSPAAAGGVDIRDLCSRLDLESGHLSRLLQALESDGLVTVTVSSSEGDGPVCTVRPTVEGDGGDICTARPTAAGAAEYAELEARSERAAAGLLEPLSDTQRRRLLTAMAEVERLLLASQVVISEADVTSRPARYAVDEYYSELAMRFQEGFDPVKGGSVRDESISPPRGLLLIAVLRDETVGCGALTFQDGGYAEIKRVWAAPAVRGLGLGRRLMAELELRAAKGGAHTVRLDTNGSLTEAIELYRRLGYREVPPYNHNPYAHHWFAKELGHRHRDSTPPATRQ